MQRELTQEAADALATVATQAAAYAAATWLRRTGQAAELDALTSALRSHIKAAWEGAMYDARQAVKAGMPDAAMETFKASMAIAGIEAAKECGFPRETIN